jgi:hypothetical protein
MELNETERNSKPAGETPQLGALRARDCFSAGVGPWELLSASSARHVGPNRLLEVNRELLALLVRMTPCEPERTRVCAIRNPQYGSRAPSARPERLALECRYTVRQCTDSGSGGNRWATGQHVAHEGSDFFVPGTTQRPTPKPLVGRLLGSWDLALGS